MKTHRFLRNARVSLFFCLACAIATPVSRAAEPASLESSLQEIARVGSVMVDGDVCERIVTDRTRNALLHPDPRDQWGAADNYDVDAPAFIQTKKTLIRLSRLTNHPVDVNLWMPVPGDASRVHIVIRNRNEMSQFWEWGQLTQPMFPLMKRVLESGEAVTVKDKSPLISVLSPVRNSLGHIVGLIEVVSQSKVDARENVK